MGRLSAILLSTLVSISLGEASNFRGLNQEERELQIITGQQGIVGGGEAPQGAYPWFAAFYPNIETKDETFVACGGTLISPDRVLTSAQCVIGDGNVPRGVRIGATDLDDGEIVEVLCAAIHPDFFEDSDGDLYNDVAVLKLAERVDSTSIVLNRDIDYPSSNSTLLGVIGFGAESDGGLSSPVLKDLLVQFVPIDECTDNFEDVLEDVHICADADDAGVCFGDAGGPLFDETHVQVGIVSYGRGGCASSSEDVYTDVAAYYPWIQFHLFDGGCDALPVGEDDDIFPEDDDVPEDDVFVDDDDNNCILDNEYIRGITGRVKSFFRRGGDV